MAKKQLANNLILSEAECFAISKVIKGIATIDGYNNFEIITVTDEGSAVEVIDKVVISDNREIDRKEMEKGKTHFLQLIEGNFDILNKVCNIYMTASDRASRTFVICSDFEPTRQPLRVCEVFWGLWQCCQSAGTGEVMQRLIASPEILTIKNQISTIGRIEEYYTVPNGHIIDDYYDFAFYSVAIKGNTDGSKDDPFRSLAIMQQRFINNDSTSKVNIICENIEKLGTGKIIFNKFKEVKNRKGETKTKTVCIIEKSLVDNNSNVNMSLQKMASFKKLFLYIIQQFYEQGCVKNIVIDVKDIVAKRIFSQDRDARNCFIEFLQYNKNIIIQNCDSAVIGSIAFSFSEDAIEDPKIRYFHIFVNDLLATAFIGGGKQFTNLPQFAYNLSNKALDLMKYICYLMRQNSNGNKIRKGESFSVSAMAISYKLFLPTINELQGNPKKCNDYIKRPIILAVAEINQKSIGLVKIVPNRYEEGTSVPEFLEHCKYNVYLDDSFAEKTKLAATVREAEKLQTGRRGRPRKLAKN